MPYTSAASSVVESTNRQGRNVEPVFTLPNNRLCVTSKQYPAKVTQSSLQQQNRNVPNIATVTSIIRFYSLSKSQGTVINKLDSYSSVYAWLNTANNDIFTTEQLKQNK
ncbi:hypothetical protein DAPPUDRAFT_262169 [Daphnia pulex]|uniref:Uncharacterized protein n=1 Tax=Daphnia pulex TaxID=6669 RepID=E9HMH7_DAPPU|nr:hypothetical protein DAPPUDRAFT_262169 [Daphnia pulex]|eukprot:EFX67053.1 hypothetical protein DAPPUDRAFT_262169 [Daphnia pulex]